MKQILFTAIIVISVIMALTKSVQAQWASNGAAVCTATGEQRNTNSISDCAGGAIIVWTDCRSGENEEDEDIYAQRIDAWGAVKWTAGGVAICTATNGQFGATITGDNAGGAVITWSDSRSGSNNDIYAQRIDSSGAVKWTTDGVAICTAANDQIVPATVSDGSCGAIITWNDTRSGTSFDIYAQRIDSLGTVKWTADGAAICTNAGNQFTPVIAGDGDGGAIIAWDDYRSGSNYHVYVQRIDSSGAVQWDADGAAFCATTSDQGNPSIVGDGNGGAIIAWMDYRSGPNSDIYAQRINPSGAVEWNTHNGADSLKGLAICTADSSQSEPLIAGDVAGGAIIVWMDSRHGSNNDIYAQRIDPSGAVQWAVDGAAICTDTNSQESFKLISENGGATVAWLDYRGGPYSDIYAQQIDASGAVKWAPDGAAICTAAGYQAGPSIVSDGAGGAIISWDDYRSDTSDVYAQVTKFVTDTTGVSGKPQMPLPTACLLVGAYPNPSRGQTAIKYQLAAQANVQLQVYNVAGQLVKTVNEGSKPAGYHQITWNDNKLSNGIYFYKLKAGQFSATKKMVVLK